ncbi:hypothetical protein [Roseococcus sp. YIM B11640]|uniref:hypothetical protein n=1 Tax=Roseococcus sp. YIM B11640 TaxID=3133973 RepID=UPI003C7A7808
MQRLASLFGLPDLRDGLEQIIREAPPGDKLVLPNQEVARIFPGGLLELVAWAKQYGVAVTDRPDLKGVELRKPD